MQPAFVAPQQYVPPRLTPVKQPVVRAQAPDEKPAASAVRIPSPEELGLRKPETTGSVRVPTPEELGLRTVSR